VSGSVTRCAESDYSKYSRYILRNERIRSDGEIGPWAMVDEVRWSKRGVEGRSWKKVELLEGDW
jgi:hypothetical protein